MNSIFNYLLNMFPYIIIVIPIFLIIRVIYLFKSKKKVDLNHEIILMIFILFLVGLFSQAFIPDDGIHRTNFIPFKILYDTYDQVFNKNNINYLIISFLGNIIMFIPIGLLMKSLWHISDKKAIIFGFSISLFIEIVQLFLNRTSDIDDLLLNTIGVVLGIILYNYYQKYKKKSSV